MNTLRMRVRLGLRLHEAWRQGPRQRDNFEFHWQTAKQVWNNLLSEKHRLQIAEDRQFTDCLPSVHEDYRWRCDELLRVLQTLRALRGPAPREPSLADWVGELQALDDEFGGYTIDDKRSILRVLTDPITLKDVRLGTFAIEFHWSRLSQQRGSMCFEIVARDPNPASGRDEVTHPHVNDGELCAGDATAPIESALSDGRISEAFVLIRSVLTHYNPRSAFIQLSEWEGYICSDCGRRMDREESSTCQSCECDLCENCSSSCRSCENTRCGRCLNACDGCGDYCCSGCLETLESDQSVCSTCRALCDGCSKTVLQSDLNENGRCSACATAEESPTPIPEETHAS